LSYGDKKRGWAATWFKRLAGLLTTVCAVLIILTAVVVGIGRAFIPHADEIRPWLEERLGERIGMPIEIGRVEAQWPRLTPQMTLSSIRVGEPDQPLIGVDSARLEVYLPGLVQADRNLFNVVVLGLDLELTEDDEGHWGMRLEGGAQLGMGNGAPAERVLAGNLLLRDVNVRIVPRRLPPSEWRLPEAELEREPHRTALVGRLHPAADQQSMLELRLRADHAGTDLYALNAWLGITRLEMDSEVMRQYLPSGIELDGRRLSGGAWLEWTPQAGGQLDLEFALEGGGREPVSGFIQAARQGRRIDTELHWLMLGEQTAVQGLQVANEDRLWALGIERVDLEVLHRLAEPVATLVPDWPEFLAGTIEQARLMFHSRDGLHALEGRIEQLELAPVGPVPGIRGLDLSLSLSGDRIAIEPGGEVSVDWPRMLRREVHLDQIGGRVLLSPDSIEFDQLAIGHSIIDAVANGWIYLGEERPFLDFGVEVNRLETGDPRPWLPHGIIPPRTLEWLDQALVHVDHGTGDLLFHMRAGQRAPDFDPGDFHARIDFGGARMDYWPGWPVGELHVGQVEFLGRSLFGQVPTARMADLDLSIDQVVIADLTEPELAFLVVTDQVDGAAVTHALASMPVAGWQGLFEQTEWSGPLSFSTEITLPFRRMEDWQLDGKVNPDGVAVTLPGTGIRVEDLRGTAFFDRHQLVPTALHAMAGQRMITLDAAAVFQAPPRLELGAELHPADLVADEALARSLRHQISGTSYWEFALTAVDDGLEMTLGGDLEGVGLSLPEPMTKLAPEAWPVKARARMAEAMVEFELAIADRIDLAARQDDRGWSIAAGINHTRPEWPDAAAFAVEARLDDLNLRPWAKLVSELVDLGETGVTTGRARMELGRLAWGDFYLRQVNLDLERSDSAWELMFDGTDARGQTTIPVPLDSGRVLAIDFSHLHVGDDSEDLDEVDLEIRQTPAQTSTASPMGRPPLHVLIEDLRYRGLDIGRARIETHASAQGVEIERVEAQGPSVHLQGSGRWIETPSGPFTEFDGRLITASLTDLLDVLDYEAGVEAARTQADISGRWPGAPQDFSLQRMVGKMAIEVADGLIPEARPGAGRLLGLVSIGTVPRRLMLDFRDVFAQGLKFDRITGTFELGDGVAVTDDVLVESPAARIRVRGSTDMVDRQYDQYLVVEPGVGGTLPLLGVLAGGPVGAAAGLVLQTLFDQPLRGIAEARYSVTGSWDSPVVELVEARVTDEEGEEEIIVPEMPPD
jgi:uncharacterized protein (TIGR02099 family)